MTHTPWHTPRSRLILLSAVAGLLTAAPSRAENRAIDLQQSTLTVLVYKSGLFSAFAHDHVIKAPIAAGSISNGPQPGIEVAVRSADLRVLDPQLSPERRADVQARMLSADVLDVTRFPDITFTSAAIEPAGSDRWNVSGRLTLHGQTRIINFSVVQVNGRYRGEVAIRQRDFGIEPVRIAAGAVKIKDEVKVQFDIVK
jgi:hypothetical protein